MPHIHYQWTEGTRYFRSSDATKRPIKPYNIPDRWQKLLVNPVEALPDLHHQIVDMIVDLLCINSMACHPLRDINVEASPEEIVAYSTHDMEGQGFIMKWTAVS